MDNKIHKLQYIGTECCYEDTFVVFDFECGLEIYSWDIDKYKLTTVWEHVTCEECLNKRTTE